MGSTVDIKGLRELDDALFFMGTSTAKALLRRVGKAALVPFDAAWRERAPVLSGKTKASGGVSTKLNHTQRAALERESFVEVYAGPAPLVQAIQSEFGNMHEAPHPFVRPAWEATKDQVLENVKTGLQAEITKNAERVARKIARGAAKAVI